jgi:hypothetical protein
MTILRKKMPDVQNVVAGGTAWLDVPLGMTYTKFFVELGGTTFTRAHIPRVRALINGKPFMRDIPAAYIQGMNLYRASKDDASLWIIDFEEPRSRLMQDQLALGVGTATGVDTFKLEFDILGTAVAPTMRVWADQVGPRPLGLLPAVTIERTDYTSTGTKQLKFPYTKEAGHILRRIHLVKSAGLAFTSVTLEKNGIPVSDRVPPTLMNFAQEHYEGVPQTDWYTIDFIEDNNTIVNLLPTEDGVPYLNIEVSAAGHLDIIYEMASRLESIAGV